MNSIKILTLLMAILALAITSLSIQPANEEPFLDNDHDDGAGDENSDIPWPDEDQERVPTLRGTSRFLARTTTTRDVMLCDKYPKVCRIRGSPGPDCCKKKCVDMKTDRLNCGKCGKKCKYSELCCKGKCVNPRSDKKNCGGCNNKCKKGSVCAYGMCSYA
ncbi:hypothetical protein Tsubulata_013392 [Turnera subulata]|uniref:Stigma-specific STIG1-like protein 1 n=1 Tax=Turnera subulata TaxID=218843 RepID=A0A9Q0G5W1_9ROSI|nr:hypothetical protein Tsubulata_013392 [Turnera subulata]